MKNNIILLNVFPNNTITYLVSKKYNTLGYTYLKYRVTNKKDKCISLRKCTNDSKIILI